MNLSVAVNANRAYLAAEASAAIMHYARTNVSHGEPPCRYYAEIGRARGFISLCAKAGEYIANVLVDDSGDPQCEDHDLLGIAYGVEDWLVSLQSQPSDEMLLDKIRVLVEE